MRPFNDDVEEFQLAVAAAEAWELLRFIEILEIREEGLTGRRLIEAIHFRHLK